MKKINKDQFDKFRQELGEEKVNQFLASLGLGPDYVAPEIPLFTCSKCGCGNAYWKEFGADCDAGQNYMALYCPDCGHEDENPEIKEAPKTKFEREFGNRVITLYSGKRGLRAQLPVKITLPSDVEGDCIDMKASDETLDRYDEVIKADGWDLTNYSLNPVIQNSHQYGDIMFTIGKALSTKVDGGALVQRWQFASDVNPMAKIAFGLYKGGYLNASSVGFIPIEWVNGNKAGEPARTYTKSELLEVSAVGIPANPNALALALKDGAIEKSDLKELSTLLNKFCKQSETPGDDSATAGRFHVAQLHWFAGVAKELAKHL